MKRRRLELNLSQKRAAGMTRMSNDTWIRVEKAQTVQPSTYDRIEEALRWTVGSCRKITEGGEPVVLDIGGEVEFATVPTADQEAGIRQAVQDVMVASTDLNAGKIREIDELVIDMLRKRGILPPADSEETQS